MKTFYLAFLLLLAATLTQAQQTYYVSTTGQDDAGRDGLSSATAWKSIAYAFQQVPAGNNTIQLGAGTFVVNQRARLKKGWTLNGQGHAGGTTTTVTNAESFVSSGDRCHNQLKDVPLDDYMLAGSGLEDVTISNIIFTSSQNQPLDGALFFKYGQRIELYNLLIKDFSWNGLLFYATKEVEVHHAFFTDASYAKNCGYWSGGMRTQYMKDLTVHHCEFKTTKGGGYGYKGAEHERAKFYENIFHNNVSKGPNDGRSFDFESAHEFEYELEIYNNTFNGMVSVPRGGSQSLTHHADNAKKFQYSIRIHDNTFYGSGGVEGPRGHLEIDHNYFVQKWNNDGRVYEVHGGANDGPVYIHHNVAECSMGFVFKKEQLDENMFIYNNTVYLINSTRNNFPTSFLEVSGGVSNWKVKNNVIFTQDSPSNGISFSRGSLPTTGLVLSNNVVSQIPNAPSSIAKHNPELALSGNKPEGYYTPASASSYVVDQGTDVGFAFQGNAPDIGAYEWNNTTPPPSPTEYTVTASAGSNGSISPSGSVSVDQGQDQSFTITPEAGYQIDDVLVDGSSVGKVATYNFTSVQADHTINAAFVIAPPDTEAPSASVISASEPTPFSVALSWTQATDNVGVTSYQVYQDGTKIATLSSSSDQTYTVTGLSASTAYVFSLKAQDAAGNQSEASNQLTITTAPPSDDTEAPTTPVLSLDSQAATTVSLSWTASTDNDQLAFYYLYQNEVQVATLPPATTTHTVTQLAPGNYAFTLKAVDAAGNQSEQSNPAVITIPAATEPGDSTDTEPPAPFELSAAASPTSLNLSWNTPRDNQAVTSYIILQNGVAVDTLPATATTYTVQNLDADSTYTFTVVAYDAAGNSSQAIYTIDLSEVVAPIPPEPEPTGPPLATTATLAPPLFTPNDDGQNDTWQLVLAPNEQLVWLKVYNQQGQVVFTATDVGQPWNGTFQNQPLPTGAYYYILTTTINNVSQTATGSVALIR